MNGKSFLWLRGLFIALLMVIWTGTGVVKADGPDVEVFASQGFYQWLEKSPYLKKIAQTPFWEDLKLSGQAVNLMGLGNRLETQLGAKISETIVREFLSAPMEISLWDAFDNEKPIRFVITLDAAPPLKNLVQLAQAYSKNAQKTTVIRRDGRDILQTRWAGRNFYHMMHQNKLTLSNNLDMLLSSKGFRQTRFYSDHCKDRQGNLKLRVSIGAWLKNVIKTLGKEQMDLAVNMDIGEAIEFHSLALIAAPAFQALGANSMKACSPWIPRRAALAVAGVYSPVHYLELIKGLESFAALNVELKLDMDKEVIPFFGKRFFFFIESLGDAATNHVLNGAAGLELNGMNEPQQSRFIDFLRLVMTRAKKSMVAEEYPGGLTIYRYADEKQPAFCLADNWLLVGSGYGQLKRTLDTAAKKRGAIADSLDYRLEEKRFAAGGYWQVLFHPMRFFKSAAKHFQYRAQTARLYNAADVKHKILPLLDILGRIPTIAIFTELEGQTLKGKVRFIEQE